MSKHQLTGLILAKELRKVYEKKSKYHGNQFYRITVLTEPKQQAEYLFVYPNVVSPKILQAIEQSKYIDRLYLFFCQKKPKRLVLTNWEELPNYQGFIQQKTKANPRPNYEERN